MTPTELAAAAIGVVAAGAEAVHVHPRDAAGAESLAAADIGAAVAAIRQACPGVPIGVSTGLWIAGQDVHLRGRLIRAWGDVLSSEEMPDFASVNLSEPGYADVASVLQQSGIGIEAGIWSPADVEAYVNLDATAGRPVIVDRVLIEVIHASAENAQPAADRILDRMDRLGIETPRLLHGEGDACWPLISYAGELGLPTRIGLEDTVSDPRGGSIADNADLVSRGLAMWRAAATSR